MCVRPTGVIRSVLGGFVNSGDGKCTRRRTAPPLLCKAVATWCSMERRGHTQDDPGSCSGKERQWWRAWRQQRGKEGDAPVCLSSALLLPLFVSSPSPLRRPAPALVARPLPPVRPRAPVLLRACSRCVNAVWITVAPHCLPSPSPSPFCTFSPLCFAALSGFFANGPEERVCRRYVGLCVLAAEQRACLLAFRPCVTLCALSSR